jgi:hypothetical protein
MLASGGAVSASASLQTEKRQAEHTEFLRLSMHCRDNMIGLPKPKWQF